MKARDVKPILFILCAVLIGSPAIAADLELKCKGWLVEEGPMARLIEFVASVSDGEVRVEADPKYDFGQPPTPSHLKLVLRKSDDRFLEFESVERMTRRQGMARIFALFNRSNGWMTISWREDEPRRRYLTGQCELLVGTRTAISPQVT
jgi:hypothetical protein